MVSEEALQIADQRREAKGKGEKEKYTHWNVEVQKIAKRDKKAFLSDQCKETEWERVKAVYCHPAYLTYMQSTS